MNYMRLAFISGIVMACNAEQPAPKTIEVSTAQQLKGAIIAEEILSKLESIERQIKSLEIKVDKLIVSPSALTAPAKKEAPTSAATPTQSKDELNMQLEKLKAFTAAEGTKPSKEMIDKLMEEKSTK